MAYNTQGEAVDKVSGIAYQRAKMVYGEEGSGRDVSLSYPLPMRDFLIDVARKRYPTFSAITKFGENPVLTEDVFETVWDVGGIYVPPTQARIHAVASSSAADKGELLSSGTATGGSVTTLEDSSADFSSDGVAVGDAVLNDSNVEIAIVSEVEATRLTFVTGIRDPKDGSQGTAFAAGDSYRIIGEGGSAAYGASIFHVQGLDASYLEQEEFVVLNGTSAVNTTKSYTRQYRARVFGPVAETGAVGQITSTAAVDGTVSCKINDGNNQSLMAVYTIPANKIGYLINWWGSITKKQAASVDFHLRVGELDGFGYVTETRDLQTAGTSSFKQRYEVPQYLPGGADIWVNADASAADIGAAAGFLILLEDA